MEDAGESASFAPGQCRYVGEGMADFAGIGIMIDFIGQAIISLGMAFWAFFLSRHGNLDIAHDEGTLERRVEKKRLQFVSDMLMIGNDIQVSLGVSYMVTVFVSWDDMDLYHLHLAYDVVSFVGISNAAALVCWTFCAAKLATPGASKPKTTGWSSMSFFTIRHRATYLFGVMFLALTILLCLRLNEWDVDAPPGRCYYSRLVTAGGNDSHPLADKIYVGITAAWMLLAIGMAAFMGVRWRKWILRSAFLQFPVHLYMAIALRSENQGRLAGDEKDENGWDFGQTTAVLLLGAAFEELVRKGSDYWKFERAARHGHSIDSDDDRDVEQGTVELTREVGEKNEKTGEVSAKDEETMEVSGEDEETVVTMPQVDDSRDSDADAVITRGAEAEANEIEQRH